MNGLEFNKSMSVEQGMCARQSFAITEVNWREAMDSRFSWLHLSDLHVGVHGQKWLWPNLKDKIYEDIEHLIERNGCVDLVIFSGDLTQRGAVEEFDLLTKILKEIWALFEKHSCAPKFFCVPGNHDLCRPSPLDPVGIVLGSWWDQIEVQEAFWRDEGKNFRDSVGSYFKNYTEWLRSLEEHNIPLLESVEGVIPGDRAGICEAGGLKIGIVGINSSWLQLSGKKYEGLLHIDYRQLASITNDDPSGWATGCILIALIVSIRK
jgi:hypothetical protein